MEAAPRQPLLSELSRRRKLALLLRHLPPLSSVLEVGAGDGWFGGNLRERGYRVTTLDLVPPADIVGDINRWAELGIAQGSFDAVVALEVVEHVDCILAIRSVCKPGGVILLSSPHPKWDWVMKILEAIHLTQKRTSPHGNLTDFMTLPMYPTVLLRPMRIHQVGVFRNEDRRHRGKGKQSEALRVVK